MSAAQKRHHLPGYSVATEIEGGHRVQLGMFKSLRHGVQVGRLSIIGFGHGAHGSHVSLKYEPVGGKPKKRVLLYPDHVETVRCAIHAARYGRPGRCSAGFLHGRGATSVEVWSSTFADGSTSVSLGRQYLGEFLDPLHINGNREINALERALDWLDNESRK